MASQPRARRVAWTCAIAAVTAVGVWYGAGLKTRQQAKEASQMRREAAVEEQFAQLQMQRAALVAKKLAIENKIAAIEARENGTPKEKSISGRDKTG